MLQVYSKLYTFNTNFAILALAPDDYTTLAIPVNTPLYHRNNLLNFRGGTRQDREIPFGITINRDINLPRAIFYLNVTLVSNAIILTPQVEIKGITIIINFVCLFSVLFFPFSWWLSCANCSREWDGTDQWLCSWQHCYLLL